MHLTRVKNAAKEGAGEGVQAEPVVTSGRGFWRLFGVALLSIYLLVTFVSNGMWTLGWPCEPLLMLVISCLQNATNQNLFHVTVWGMVLQAYIPWKTFNELKKGPTSYARDENCVKKTLVESANQPKSIIRFQKFKCILVSLNID